MNKALFLDRDGTIIIDKENLFYIKDIKFIDGIFDLLLAAKKRSYKIIMVTNQTIVSRGLQKYSKMKKINNVILDKINVEIGIKAFDDVFICPYHPNANVKKYRFDSYFRKPKPGMLTKAQIKFNINLSDSLMVGDRKSDIIAGNLAGCKTVMIKGKFNNSKLIETSLKANPVLCVPDYKVKNLKEIIHIMDIID
jgi:D,D-heptose 1,7-bisphosphate phosphatase